MLEKYQKIREKGIVEILNVFDFDGTLMDSPSPENGKLLYEQITGDVWPYKGWWGRTESLIPFDVKPIEDTVAHYAEVTSIPFSTTVLMTNRLPKFEGIIKEKLEPHYDWFDHYDFFMGEEKPDRVKRIINEFPSIHTINIFEDMDKQVDLFKSFNFGSTIKSIKIFHFKGGKYETLVIQ